ncbi:MAG: SlyX family protein [Pseudomonadota bacterium]|jgi:SlyX protein|uniref:Protein SlyX homolog n=2 Tax=Alteromonas TaxID=226 RepID=A0A2S9VFI1_9ALTE|nr:MULTISPECIES: SlyX family protein [Alteromonas]MDG6097525.1 SlyX family protein [Alteromonas sp. ZYF713]MEC9260717.1 SlyX family protein [Pseudomonadota bacterium]HAU93509.1 SlyX protein [Alteromonas sp.]PRO75221.1 SlyX protein [Alteromonas alba]HCA76470.1 SlyX protein [Alteromonas sp.]|tara:strand:- start:1350 stop:1595 length:246 start_codon:yes stop_codon:yes gene_type:complete
MTTNNDKLANELAKAEEAIAELETKVAFQEHTIDALNEALAHQQIQIDKMQFQLRHVIDKVKGMEPSNIAKMSEETPPPHY